MKNNNIIIAFGVLLMAVLGSAKAQTAAEIATARQVAKAYGYSDSEIDAVLGHDITGASTPAAAASTPANVTPTATPDPQVTVLRQIAAAAVDEGADAIYGHEYFISAGLANITTYNAPAPGSYILGPGDEVVVDIWGATVSHVVATIQNDGGIQMADLGPVYLAGMSISSAEKSLKQQLSRIYAGLSDERGDTFLRVSVGKMKGVVINVSGEVVTPGVYNLPSLASIPSAIFMAGGVRETGSVRSIVIYRKGRKVATFDLYKFLFSGKSDENLRLQDGDVINVEPYGSIARIGGAVMRPMRYEFREGETVADLIKFAGGFTTAAQRNGVHISRTAATANKDMDLGSAQFGTFKLVDGDVVSVRSYRSDNENSVTLSGPVKFPGSYAIGKDIKDVASLIEAAGGLTEGAFTGYGQINRLDRDRQPTFVTFDLAKVLSGETKVSLTREDQVVIYSHDDFITNQSVSISGAVGRPGVYSFHTGMKVSELINEAGGLTENAYLARAIVSHESRDGQPVTAPFNVNDAGSVTLMRNDAVRIYSIGELKQKSTVRIMGEVNAPGTYPYREGLTIANLVDFAMGYTDGVDMTNVQISSRGGRERGTVETINLEENPELLDKVLRPYDAVSFRRLTYYREQITVNVVGEVISPGNYVVDKPEVRISDVMARTGGFTDEAYPHGAKLVRVLTQEEIDRQKMAVMIASKDLDDKSVINLDALTDRFTIGIDLEEAIANPGSTADIILRSGDVIQIPQMNNTVKVSGGVLYPNTVAFDSNMNWKSYVKQAGGFTKLARRGKTYAIYMNGKVAVGNQIYIEPGMELVVPERKESDVQAMSPVEIAALASSTTSIAALVTSIIKMF